MQVAKGLAEKGVVVGNYFDKYHARNPMYVWMLRRFQERVDSFVRQVKPRDIHEIGCGEGYWVLHWRDCQIEARGSDFSGKVIELARGNALVRGCGKEIFKVRNIYDLTREEDSAELLVCIEVMEHLEDPRRAFSVLQGLWAAHIILSVPNEPLWRILNLCRGKYLGQLGNTPGHIQHWSRAGFVDLAGSYFEVVSEVSSAPWTIVLCRGIGGR